MCEIDHSVDHKHGNNYNDDDDDDKDENNGDEKCSLFDDDEG